MPCHGDEREEPDRQRERTHSSLIVVRCVWMSFCTMETIASTTSIVGRAITWPRGIQLTGLG